jgi:Spy/CpxP family protein refolding chaperone
MKLRIAAFALATLAALAAGVHAQPGPPQDPIGQALYPPEMVMQHQQALGITAAQRATITGALEKTQSRLLEIQWDMQGASHRLIELLSASPVDETAALAQVDRVLELEREVKRAQLSLLIRIKNALSREQQAKLETLRGAERRER